MPSLKRNWQDFSATRSTVPPDGIQAIAAMVPIYVNLRRDSVAKEAIHVLLGITPDGHKEVLDYAILPSESALNYADMLKSLKKHGLEQVLLFVSDVLSASRTRYKASSHMPNTRASGFILCVR